MRGGTRDGIDDRGWVLIARSNRWRFRGHLPSGLQLQQILRKPVGVLAPSKP